MAGGYMVWVHTRYGIYPVYTRYIAPHPVSHGGPGPSCSYGDVEMEEGCSHEDDVGSNFEHGTYVWVEAGVVGVGHVSLVVAPGPKGPRFLVGWADNQGYCSP